MREIGIRMALGADRRTIISLMMWKTVVLAGTGTALGIGLAIWGGRLLRGFLFGVSLFDPLTMTLVPLVLFACALLATMLPATRAASVDPVQALRAE
jgi:ABC-type antimicrobial peptide transport system permease subunit